MTATPLQKMLEGIPKPGEKDKGYKKNKINDA